MRNRVTKNDVRVEWDNTGYSAWMEFAENPSIVERIISYAWREDVCLECAILECAPEEDAAQYRDQGMQCACGDGDDE